MAPSMTLLIEGSKAEYGLLCKALRNTGCKLDQTDFSIHIDLLIWEGSQFQE